MKYCVKCDQPDTRSGIKFKHQGGRSACNFATEALVDNGKENQSAIEEGADYGRKHGVNRYDCIRAIRGARGLPPKFFRLFSESARATLLSGARQSSSTATNVENSKSFNHRVIL